MGPQWTLWGDDFLTAALTEGMDIPFISTHTFALPGSVFRQLVLFPWSISNVGEDRFGFAEKTRFSEHSEPQKHQRIPFNASTDFAMKST